MFLSHVEVEEHRNVEDEGEDGHGHDVQRQMLEPPENNCKKILSKILPRAMAQLAGQFIMTPVIGNF